MSANPTVIDAFVPSLKQARAALDKAILDFLSGRSAKLAEIEAAVRDQAEVVQRVTLTQFPDKHRPVIRIVAQRLQGMRLASVRLVDCDAYPRWSRVPARGGDAAETEPLHRHQRQPCRASTEPTSPTPNFTLRFSLQGRQ